jgi:hypothetical protein
MITWDSVQQFVRMGLQAAAGALVTKGYLDAAAGEALTGGLLSIASVAWWVVWNRKRAA